MKKKDRQVQDLAKVREEAHSIERLAVKMQAIGLGSVRLKDVAKRLERIKKSLYSLSINGTKVPTVLQEKATELGWKRLSDKTYLQSHVDSLLESSQKDLVQTIFEDYDELELIDIVNEEAEMEAEMYIEMEKGGE